MAFADHYPQDVFENGVRTSRIGRDESKAYQKDFFFPAVEAHLLELRAQGRLGVTGGVAGRDVWSATGWNQLVVEGTFAGWLTSYLTSMLFHTASVEAESASVFDPEYHDPDVTPERLVRRAWLNLCEQMDAGTTNHRFRLEAQQDANTGDQCQLSFTDWKATLMVWNGHDMEPAQDMGAIPLATIEFDCPSGELILTDAMTAGDDVFRTAVDLGDRRYTTASLNSSQGCINYSTIVAREYGFGVVVTDNTSVVVHRQGDRIMVSERWADEELRLEDADGDVTVRGWDKVGTFCCDRVTVEIIDRQVALDIMSGHGIADAAAALDAWIAAQDEEVVVMKVTPGRYRVHFGPGFSQRFDRFEADIPSGPEPWLVMEPVA